MSILFQMPMFWLLLVIIFIVIEAFTFALTSIWFAIGSLFALVVALIGIDFPIQIISFFVVSIVLLIFTRPIAKNYLHIGSEKTNIDSIIGKKAIVIKEIQSYKTGQVRIDGQIWTAKSIDSDFISEGVEVEVVLIEGVKVVVRPII